MSKLFFLLGLIAVCSAAYVPISEDPPSSYRAVRSPRLTAAELNRIRAKARSAIDGEGLVIDAPVAHEAPLEPHKRSVRSPSYYYASPSYVPLRRALWSANSLWSAPTYYI